MPAGPVPPKGSSKRLAQEQRQARLAAELRSNLRKRKAQGRAQALPEEAGSAHEAHEQDGQKQQPHAREAASNDAREPTGEVA